MNLSLTPLRDRLFRKQKGIVILHGPAIHYLSPKQTMAELTPDLLHLRLSSKPKPLILLAAPFLNSFVHETIPLAANELDQVDSRILPFSQTTRENRQITSINISNKRALTIHSHLSKEGIDFLNSLRKNRISVSWKPAIAFIVRNLMMVSRIDSHRDSFSRIFLNNEMLQMRWQGNLTKFQHITYWHRSMGWKKNKLYVDQLLHDSLGSEMVTAISLSCQQQDTSDQTRLTIKQLFFPTGNTAKVKSTQRKYRKEPLNLIKHLSVNRVFIVVSGICLVWTGLMEFQIGRMKKKHLLLSKEIKELELSTDKLAEIAIVEREFLKLQSLLDAVDQTKFLPNKLFELIEASLPPTTWIFQIHAAPQEITIDLLDEKNIELSQLIDTFNRRIGKTSVEMSEKTEIDSISLNRYTIKIRRNPQDSANE